MDNQSVFTGALSHDAPGLDVTLRKYLLISDFETVKLAYQWVYERNGLDENSVNRSPGVTFNPKPARYCQILISYNDERAHDQFISAMLMCLSENYLTSVNDFPTESIRALEAQNICNSGLTKHSPSLEIKALVTTKLLDDVRHFHMSSLEAAQIEERLTFITHEIIPFLSLPRMKVLLESAVERSRIFLIDRMQ